MSSRRSSNKRNNTPAAVIAGEKKQQPLLSSRSSRSVESSPMSSSVAAAAQQQQQQQQSWETTKSQDTVVSVGSSTTAASGRQQQQQQAVVQQRPPRRRLDPGSGAAGGSAIITPRTSIQHQPHGAAAIGPSPSPAAAAAGVQPHATSLTSLTLQQQQQQQMAAAAAAANNNFLSMESPLPPVVQRSLGDRSNEKRKNAALEIEALVRSLQEAKNPNMIHSVICVLSKDFCTSMNSNYRKGGLVGLAATAIGFMAPHTHNPAASAQQARAFLPVLLPPVLHCFDDPESRVRYYACESLYNIAKVSRGAVLEYFNQIFEGLTKLFADVDVDVKNGANLLDRLVKDIVTEADSFSVVDQFLPLLQNYIRRTNPYIRQLIVGWITLLDSIPDMNMLDYLPDFLDGLFNMLSDSNREIRQAADSALSEFLRALSCSKVIEFGPMISILVQQCQSKERLNRLTAITWLAELINHPYRDGNSGGGGAGGDGAGADAFLPFHADLLRAILICISDGEKEIRLVAERTNNDLLLAVQHTTAAATAAAAAAAAAEADGGSGAGSVVPSLPHLRPLIETVATELLHKEDVPTKMATLRWINMLMEQRTADMAAFTHDLLPVLLRTLSDPADAVVLLDLQVLSRISLSSSSSSQPQQHKKKQQQPSLSPSKKKNAPEGAADTNGGDDDNDEDDDDDEEAQFQLVLNAILHLFAQDRQLLETRGSLIIRKLCVLLNAKSVYIRMADTLASYEVKIVGTNTTSSPMKSGGGSSSAAEEPATARASQQQQQQQPQQSDLYTLQFVSTMVQTLNLILLTAQELHDLRTALAGCFQPASPDDASVATADDSAGTPADPSATASDHRATATATARNHHNAQVFCTLFHCWCHNPVATFSLCLLAQAYDLSFCLVQRFSEMHDFSVGFFMQMDKLVHLLESPIFCHLRLSLLDADAPQHVPLLKSIYGLLMCLPQGDAFCLLNERLATVSNLRDCATSTSTLPNSSAPFYSTTNSSYNGGYSSGGGGATTNPSVPMDEANAQHQTLNLGLLLERFDQVTEQHRQAREQAQQRAFVSASTSGVGMGMGMGDPSTYQQQQQQQGHAAPGSTSFMKNKQDRGGMFMKDAVLVPSAAGGQAGGSAIGGGGPSSVVAGGGRATGAGAATSSMSSSSSFHRSQQQPRVVTGKNGMARLAVPMREE